jgi:phosphinothricin acetyltransferase
MTIRAAAAGDFDAIASITNHYIATTAIHFGYEPIAAAELAATRAADARYPWLVLDDGGAIAGYAKAGAWRPRDAYAWTCETGIYIADAARGRGLGRSLYAALLHELARGGFRSVVAGITLPNAASVALHERLGFAAVGVVKEAGYKHGAWHDVGFWQKRLANDPV